jgi:hypothetical protein
MRKERFQLMILKKLKSFYQFIIVLFHNNNHYDYIKSLPAFSNEKNSASFVFNIIKMIFFTNVSRFVNFVREKLAKKR